MKVKLVIPEVWYRTVETEAPDEQAALDRFLNEEWAEDEFTDVDFAYSHTLEDKVEVENVL